MIKGLLISMSLTFTSLLTGCGDLILDPKKDALAVVEVKELSTTEPIYYEVELDLKKGKKLEFWTTMDIEYFGDPELAYVVEIWKEGRPFGEFELNAFETNPTINAAQTKIGSKTTHKYTGKLNFLKMAESGRFTVKFILFCSDKEAGLNKAELILR